MFREGRQIGHYKLIRKLGRGGFGEVWLAERKSKFVTTKVAVKLPLDEQVDHESIRQEATLWEQASGHPNILPIIDADEYDGQIVIVSEYAPDGTLADKLKSEGKIAVRQAVEMIIGILNGLEFLHSKRIIHRDIKPQNILLQGTTPRLADFGISRAMQTTTVSSAVIGTDAYMSPESYAGKRNIQTDIWSIGVVLYQMVKGSVPFPQEHPSERMYAILTKEFEPLSNDIPPNLKHIIFKALAKQPEARYQNSGEMRKDLQNVLLGKDVSNFVQFESHQTSPVSEISSKKEFTLTSDQDFRDEVETIVRSNSNKIMNAAAIKIDEPVIAININKSFRNDMSAIDLYDYTRGIWRLSKERAKGAKYAFAVYQGLIKEVFEIHEWFQAGATKYQKQRFNPDEFKTRFEFTGKVADNEIRDKYIGEQLPDKHSQNPIRYYNC